jgi:hypothetical protein
MPRQRPALRNVGAVACAALSVGLLLAGCSDRVGIASPQLTGEAATTCAALIKALPDSVADQPRREVDPADAYGAAWGDPAIVLRCGVATPKGFDRFSSCQVANGVGWYIPEEQMQGSPNHIVMTTVGRSLNVEVRLPEKYWPPAAAMVDLADAIKQTVREDRPCL